MVFSNYLRVHMFVILPSFAEITEINTRENMQELYVHVINCWIGYLLCLAIILTLNCKEVTVGTNTSACFVYYRLLNNPPLTQINTEGHLYSCTSWYSTTVGPSWSEWVITQSTRQSDDLSSIPDNVELLSSIC